MSPVVSSSAARRSRFFFQVTQVIAVFAALGACKQKAVSPPEAPRPSSNATAAPPVPAPTPPLPEIACPAPEAFASFASDPSNAATGRPARAAKRTLFADCIVYAPGRFWLAAALSYDEKTRKNLRLGLISGSPNGRSMVFDITPIPTAAIEKLLQRSHQIGVQIRKTRDSQSLLRIGVTGGAQRGKPDRQEVGMLLQLVAHRSPQILWMGPGDEITSEDNGCVTERRVEFDLLFRTRLEQLTITRSMPDAAGKLPAHCPPGGPSTQETLALSPVDLPPGRAFTAAAATSNP